MEAWSGAQAVAGLFYPSLRSPDKKYHLILPPFPVSDDTGKGAKKVRPEEIKKLREAVGLTQEVFAISPGSSPGLPSVKRWELGTAKPGRLALARLEEFRRRGEMSAEEADEALIKKLVAELKASTGAGTLNQVQGRLWSRGALRPWPGG